MENLCLHNVSIIKSFDKIEFKQKTIKVQEDF